MKQGGVCVMGRTQQRVRFIAGVALLLAAALAPVAVGYRAGLLVLALISLVTAYRRL
jgi:hypothetical protein